MRNEGLDRFVDAQDGDCGALRSCYETALAELRAGRKRGHWIWFVFPQMDLGASYFAHLYAIDSLDEARAYLEHPVLGARLRECCDVLMALRTSDPVAVLGHTDAMKLRSSMTLFLRAAPEVDLFGKVLEHFYGGELDPLTLERLSRAGE